MRRFMLALALLAFFAVRAEAKHVHFLGPHPVAMKLGGGYCYIEAPHFHAYLPDHLALYQEQDGEYVFTGDPTPFGYEGPKFTFYGNHPVVGAPANVYCFIDGPHYHAYPPPEAPDYRVDKGVAFYVGPFQPPYYKERPHRVKLVAAEYRPYVAVRPVIDVRPPPEWHGEVWIAPPTVEVNVPGVMIAPPQPQIYIGAPPAPHVYITPPRPDVYFAPPAPHVYIGAPPPFVVGVPGRVRREHDDDDGEWRRGEHEHEHGHRDEGERHGGKHEHEHGHDD